MIIVVEGPIVQMAVNNALDESEFDRSEATEFVLVSERFHPDTTSTTGQLMTDLAGGLQKRDLDMTVLTRTISEMEGDVCDNRLDEVTVKRAPIPELPGSSLFHRAFEWIIFVLFVFFTLLIDRPKKNRELLFVSHPPILPPMLWLVCKFRSWDYTYIIYDFYPDAAVKLGYLSEGGVVHKIWSWINIRLLSKAKYIVTLGPLMRDHIVRSCQREICKSKISIIHNWDDKEFIVPRAKADNWFSMKHNLEDSFTLVYSGNIGKFHDLETVVTAATQFTDKNVKILIIGEGDNKQSIVELAANLGVLDESVTVLPYQPYEDVPYTLTSGDATIVAVNEEFQGLCVSSKLYSSLAAGQPILVVSAPDDDEARIVESFDAGVQVSPDNSDAIIETIERWRSNPELVERQGINARRAFETYFTKEHSVDKYFKLLTGQDISTADTQETQVTT